MWPRGSGAPGAAFTAAILFVGCACSPYDLTTEKDDRAVSFCGNGVVETAAYPSERCERGDTRPCEAVDAAKYYEGGFAYCRFDCSDWILDDCIPKNICGNGVIEGAEECESGDTITCAAYDAVKYLGGTVFCDDTKCSWKTTDCVERDVCGNGVIEEGELCEPTLSPTIRCVDIGPDGYVAGIAYCLSDCAGWDKDDCIPAQICGNGVPEEDNDEVCDTPYPVLCSVVDAAAYVGGYAHCRDDCGGWDVAGCLAAGICGNGVVEEGELCERGASASCRDIDETSFLGGYAYCQDDCRKWDFSTCIKENKCGNGIIDDITEECEKGQSVACLAIDPFAFVGGDAPCNATCSGWDVAPCLLPNTCGNGIFELGEECEKEDAIPCGMIDPDHFYPGSASCLPDCSGWDVDKCTEKDVCGNGILETGEPCERGAKLACAELDGAAWAFGVAACTYECTGWNTDNCIEHVGPEGMIEISGGAFTMGCDPAVTFDCMDHERPPHQIVLSPYRIDRYEVTVAAYKLCVAAGACKGGAYGAYGGMTACNLGSDRDGRMPMNCVSWEGARDYCAWRGKRLPTEAEWEYAARGDGRTYPWGYQKPDCGRAVFNEGGLGCGEGGTLPIGSLPAGDGPWGLADAAGNVREWVADWYRHDYYWYSEKQDPRGPTVGTQRVLRGGSYAGDERQIRTYARYAIAPKMTYPEFGFRCAD